MPDQEERKYRFDPYTGEEIVGHSENGNGDSETVENDGASRDPDPDAGTTKIETVTDAAFDYVADRSKKAGSAIARGWQRLTRGYDDRDVRDMGFATVDLMTAMLPGTYEYRGNPKLASAVSALSDYKAWRTKNARKVGQVIGDASASDIEKSIQRQLASGWNEIWKALSKATAYDVSAGRPRVKDGYYSGKGMRCAWQRLVRGYDDWQLANFAMFLQSRLSVLLARYAEEVESYPDGYPTEPKLFVPSEDLAAGEDRDPDQARFETWKADCLAASQAMEISASMCDAGNPVTKTLSGYGTAKQRKSIQASGQKAWKWIGDHLADLWE